MSKLKVIRGAVLEGQHSVVNEVSQIGRGDASTITSRPVSHSVLWIETGDKALPVTLDDFDLPFRVGQIGAFVLRGGVTMFAFNETTEHWSAIKARLVPWASTVATLAFIAFLIGTFALVPFGKGAPIGGFVLVCLLSPVLAGIAIWRARRRTMAQCWELVRRKPD